MPRWGRRLLVRFCAGVASHTGCLDRREQPLLLRKKQWAATTCLDHWIQCFSSGSGDPAGPDCSGPIIPRTSRFGKAWFSVLSKLKTRVGCPTCAQAGTPVPATPWYRSGGPHRMRLPCQSDLLQALLPPTTGIHPLCLLTSPSIRNPQGDLDAQLRTSPSALWYPGHWRSLQLGAGSTVGWLSLGEPVLIGTACGQGNLKTHTTVQDSVT